MQENVIPAGVRAIFFDAVGTLLHPEPTASAAYATIGRRFGSKLDEAAIARRFSVAFHRQEEKDRAAGWRTSEVREVQRWRQIVGEVLHDTADPEACFQALFTHFARGDSWRIDPDAGQVLAGLSARSYTLGVASNYDHRLRKIVAALPEFAHFAHLAISAELGWRKPSPEFFSAVTAQAGLDAEQILLVGDDLKNDYQGASAAGLHAVLLDPECRFPALNRIRGLGNLLS